MMTSDNERTTEHTPNNGQKHRSADTPQANQDTIAYLLAEGENLQKKLKDNNDLSRFLKDVTLLLGMIKDYSVGNYRVVPYKTIVAVVFGLLYVLNPIDFIPDFIPIIGYIDDAIVIALCLRLAERDLKRYERWKQANK